jgi:hypothetical protein
MMTKEVASLVDGLSRRFEVGRERIKLPEDLPMKSLFSFCLRERRLGLADGAARTDKNALTPFES